MTDFADLAVRVDSTSVKTLIAELDKIPAAGARAEAATSLLTGATAEAKVETDRLKSALAAGTVSQAQYKDKTDAMNAALGQFTTAQRLSTAEALRSQGVMAGVTASAATQRVGMQELATQLSDVARGFALGQSPMTIFAQQGAQVVGALGAMRGAAGGLAAFLSGPWGVVFQVAVTVLGTFGAALLASGKDSQSAASDWREAKTAAEQLADSMRIVMALRKRSLGDEVNVIQMGANSLRERQLKLEAEIQRRSGGRKQADGSPMFAYKEGKELAAVKQQLMELNSEIGIGTAEIQRREAADLKAAAAVGKHTSATGGHIAASRVRTSAISDESRALERQIALMERLYEATARDAADNLFTAGADSAKQFGIAGEADWQNTFGIKKPVAPVDEAETARLERLSTAMQNLQDIAGTLDFGGIFGRGGEAIDGMLQSLDRLGAAQSAYATAMGAAGTDQMAQAKAGKLLDDAKFNGTMAMIGASKRLFSEQSAGYKIISAAEKVMFGLKLANSIKSMIMGTAETAASVGNSAVKATADQAAGASKMFSQLGVFAFPVVAAMIALLAGLGVGGGKGGGGAPPMSASDLQAGAGTGSVLGDSKGKSNSIANSLEIVASNSDRNLEYSNAMLASLQAIEGNIGKMAGSVARQISVSGGMFDTSGQKLGSSGSGGFLGMFSSSTTRTLWDVGINLVGSKVADIIANGIGGQTYQTVQQVKKKSGFFGIGGSTKTTYQTTTGAIDPAITGAIQDVITSLRDGLVSAAGVFGMTGAEALLNSFSVNIGKLSFKDMTGEEIEKQLNAVFSKVGDNMAASLMPALLPLQKIGEGMFETFMRLAREYQVVDTALSSIGMAFGMVGVESIAARDNLVTLVGGLSAFAQTAAFYRDNFLTEAERMAPVISAVGAEMDRLGLSGVDTIDRFKAVVSGLDLTSAAGRVLYAALMQVAPAFASVEKYQTRAIETATADAKKRGSLLIELMRLQGNAAGALALTRSAELAAMDETLRPLQMLIYHEQDLAKARGVLSVAYKRERGELQATADKFRGLGDSLRAFRAGLATESGGGSYQGALGNLKSVGNMAALGNERSLAALPDAARGFLDAAKANAATLIDYRRDVARAAGFVDRGIAGADGMVSAAERQQAALDKQVKGLIDIDAKVLTVAEALGELKALIGPPTLALAGEQAAANAAAKDFQDRLLNEVQNMRAENTVRDIRLIELTAETNRFWTRAETAGVPVKNVTGNRVLVTTT